MDASTGRPAGARRGTLAGEHGKCARDVARWTLPQAGPPEPGGAHWRATLAGHTGGHAMRNMLERLPQMIRKLLRRLESQLQ